MTVGEEGGVGERVGEASLNEVILESHIPHTRSLFEPVDRFIETTYMVRASRVNKAWRLHHIHLFCKCTLKEGIVDVKLAYGP